MKTLTERITELEHTVNESITSREKDLGPFIKAVQDLTAGANAMNWTGVACIGSFVKVAKQRTDELAGQLTALRTNFETQAALLGAHDNRMDRMDVSSARLGTEIEGIKSHNVTAQAVCINALNELQTKLGKVTDIALRLMERVEGLERSRSYGPAIIDLPPGVGVDRPIVTCQKEATIICEKEVGDWGMPVG
jgi:hypothetical protein